MSDRLTVSRIAEQVMPALRIVGLLFFLLAGDCVAVELAPPQTGAPQGAAVAVEPPTTGATGKDAATTDEPAAMAPAAKPAEQPAEKPSTTSSSEKPGAPPLDLTALETRLKKTKAIGVFTKITLKNQVDDLLDRFRAHYQGRTKTTLDELRKPYDRLLLKVLALLQDDDPELARAVVASREAIWGILADPDKFASL